MHNYVVTAHKPSRVTHTAVGNFLGPDQRNLLVAKVNHIQVYTITPEGLVCTVVLPIYGTISAMQLMRQPSENQDYLIVLTEKFKLSIMKWNVDDGRCQLVSSADTQDHCASSINTERIGIVDPLGRCIAIHQSRRLLRIIPTAPDADKTSFNVRLMEETIIDMVFLHGQSVPTIAMLCAPSKDSRELHTYTISMPIQDISHAPWRKNNLDATASKLVAIPEPHAGVLVFADDTIIYASPQTDEISVNIDTAFVTAVGRVGSDGLRYLVGDHKGQLMMLMICRGDNGKCQRLRVEILGETSTAQCISYLDSGFVYIGSNTGDSQLIKLSTTPLPSTNAYVEVVQTFPHLGPIVDFCIIRGMGHLRQGQGQVITCSGVGKDGSLRIIRNGIGISEYASEELPGINGLFSLRRSFKDRYDRYLVQSFLSETHVLELVSAEEMAPAALPGFDEDSSTIFAGNMEGDVIVQVTRAGIRIVDCAAPEGNSKVCWVPPKGDHISISSANARQLLVATTDRNLVYFDIDVENKNLVERGSRKMRNEVSCLSCHPLETTSDMTDSDNLMEEGEAFIAAVGLWSEMGEAPIVELIALPSLKTVELVELGGDTISRSVLLATLEKLHYLVVAVGDGSLVTFALKLELIELALAAAEKQESMEDTKSVVMERRRLSVGTKPADLRLFKSKGADHIFAACDRPTVVYSSTGGGKLLVSNVNLQPVTRVCGFDTEGFPECLAIATTDGLHLGAVDEIQKLHITSVPLGEQPRRIEHLESKRVFAILSERTVLEAGGDEALEHYVRVIDDSRYDTLDRYKLKADEGGSATLVCYFNGENIDKDEEFLVIGTATELADQEDPKEGRILIMRIVDGHVVLSAEKTVDGAVYSMCCYQGMLLVSVGTQVRLLSVSERKDGTLNIKEEDRHDGYILGFRLALRGDFILVGDLLRSVAVLTCKKVGEQFRLEEIARDHDVTWVMALQLLDDETYVVAEHAKHLYTYKRKARATLENERSRLERVGQFHLGQRVNKIEHGSLVMQMAEQDGPALNTLVFGTTDGMLGVIAQLKPDVYQFMVEMENAMATLIPGVGGLIHAEWREMVHDNPPRTAPARNFVDGDLVERFLDLPAPQMARVAGMVNKNVDYVIQRVEEMHRLHGAG